MAEHRGDLAKRCKANAAGGLGKFRQHLASKRFDELPLIATDLVQPDLFERGLAGPLNG
jgi:hypothetical protein